MTVHILHEGFALCGAGMPVDWPQGHTWVGIGIEEFLATPVLVCDKCRRTLRDKTEAPARPHEVHCSDSIRVGDWFQTHSGVKFYPLDALPDEINIEDIAHALSHVCRFGGHTRSFYSVAQHSVLVSRIVPRHLALEGLLHDASEAYLGDMVRPLKLNMPTYRDAEQRLEQIIAARFGLTFPWPPEIKEADNCALMTERRDLLAVHREWSWRAEPMAEAIEPWAPEDAKRMFLEAFDAWKREG